MALDPAGVHCRTPSPIAVHSLTRGSQSSRARYGLPAATRQDLSPACPAGSLALFGGGAAEHESSRPKVWSRQLIDPDIPPPRQHFKQFSSSFDVRHSASTAGPVEDLDGDIPPIPEPDYSGMQMMERTKAEKAFQVRLRSGPEKRFRSGLGLLEFGADTPFTAPAGRRVLPADSESLVQPCCALDGLHRAGMGHTHLSQGSGTPPSVADTHHRCPSSAAQVRRKGPRARPAVVGTGFGRRL